MNTRNLLDVAQPALVWLLVPIFFAAVLALIVLVAVAPDVAVLLAVLVASILWMAYRAMGRRS
ncbi:MAG: hypothetical protein IJO71_12690 [Microbacterium sp.]|uniref:hypothetical protein n=1 Tax=Microbacterium sp. TaxID=51671 RepID=UPI0025E40253|nr:hypothetical protein [Microbacterium sp.]MBQ9918041.1 hypothetical protein [Microbacterium sp.]